MRNTDCYRLAKLLLPQLPEFVTNKKNEIFIAPIGNVLRGFLFESSAYAREDFYFRWFFMPLVDPIEYITLGYGSRLNVPGGHAGWSTDMDDLPDKIFTAIQPKILPKLRAIHTNAEVVAAIRELRNDACETDPNILQDIAHLQILDHDFNQARVTLDKLIANENGDDRRQWILNLVERAKGLKKKLTVDPQLAIDQIHEWQDYTFKVLKLEKWR